MDKAKVTKKQLKRKIEILEANSIHALTDAFQDIEKCGESKYFGSGVTITIKNINKDNPIICNEFLIIDGLSEDTIKAIKADIKRTYDLKVSLSFKI